MAAQACYVKGVQLDVSKGKDSSVLVAMIVMALLGITGVAWLFLNGEERTTVTQEPALSNAERQQPSQWSADRSNAVDKPMQMAELAFQAGQLATPAESSAVHFYRQVLSLDPTNPRALTGMNLIATQLTDEALEQLEKREYEAAAATLNLLDDVAPESANVAAVRLGLVEKKQIMYAAMDDAIDRQKFDQAEKLARRLRVFPSVDSARISAALVQIATARNQSENIRIAIADTAPQEEIIRETGDSAVEPKRTEAAMVAMAEVGKALIPGAQAHGPEKAASATPAIEYPEIDAASTVTSSTQDSLTIATTEVFPGIEDEVTIRADQQLLTEDSLISPDTVTQQEREVQTLIATATDRVASNQLISPENDSARHYYQQALLLDPGNAEAKRGLRSLVQSITADALHKGEMGDWTAAKTLLAQAHEVGYAENIVTQTEATIKQLRLAVEQEKLVSIDQFMVKKAVAPKYPRRAVSRSVEGWVTLEFVVDASGETRDIKVIESSKKYATQFSKAAIGAVEQWRFKPRTFEGQAISQRSKTTLQFKLHD